MSPTIRSGTVTGVSHETPAEVIGINAGPAATDLDLLDERLCPLCGRGPWVVPLSHVARAHKVPGPEIRRLFGLKAKDSVTAPEHRAWRAEENRRLAAELPTRYRLYSCATCGVEFRGPRFRDGQGVPRYCSVNCKRKGRR